MTLLIIRYLRHNPFLSNVLLITGGSAAAQIITILCTPVVTRLFTPSDFGVFTLFVSGLGIIGQLSTLRYSVAIPLANDDDIAQDVLTLCFLTTVVVSFLLAIILHLFGDYFTNKLSIEHAAPYLWILPVCLLGAGLYEALAGWAVRSKDFKILAKTRLSQSVSSSVIKIGLGLLGVKPLGLLFGLLASELAGSGRLLIKLLKDKPRFFCTTSWSGIRYAAKRFSRFPLIQGWSQLLLSLGVQLPIMFMASLYGSEVVGQFGLAHSIVNMPMTLFGSSVSQVYYAEIAKYGKHRPEQILKLSIMIVKQLLFVGIIPISVIALFGPFIFSRVFGFEWYEAGVFARLLSALVLFRFISTPIMHSLNVLEQQYIQLALNALRVVFILTLFYMCHYYTTTHIRAVFLYSVSLSIYYSIQTVIILRQLFAETRYYR